MHIIAYIFIKLFKTANPKTANPLYADDGGKQFSCRGMRMARCRPVPHIFFLNKESYIYGVILYV